MLERMSSGAKTGRPSKGHREPVNFWMQPELKHAARDRAAELGMSLTDYLALLVAKDTGYRAAREGLPFAHVA